MAKGGGGIGSGHGGNANAAGTANTGGGGGGGDRRGSQTGAAGGSGVVLIKYPSDKTSNCWSWSNIINIY